MSVRTYRGRYAVFAKDAEQFGSGIQLTDRCTVENMRITGNLGHGISAGDSTIVADCQARPSGLATSRKPCGSAISRRR